jgi:hypothetical protein
MLLSFVPTIAVIAERQVERWRARQLDVPAEIAAAMTRSTFEIIVDVILGGSARLRGQSSVGRGSGCERFSPA